MTQSPVLTGLNGRDPKGRFGLHNSLAKGNPNFRRMSDLRRAVVGSETPESVAEVLAKMRDLALEGDVAAAKVYLETVIGKAPQAVELTGADGEKLGPDAAAIVVSISAALAPFSEDVRFAVLGAMKRVVDAGRTE